MRTLMLVLFFSLARPAALAADDGAITGVGGTLHLMEEHPGIALVGEHVHANLDRVSGIVDVECVFVLSNHGQADSVLIGFPEQCSGDTQPEPFLSFRSFVDGQEFACSRVPSGKMMASGQLYWWTKQVYFHAGQTRVIRDVYRAKAGLSLGDPEGGMIQMFDYALWTGASWNGDIGSATVVFTATPCDSMWSVVFSSPAPTAQDACEYRWSYSDFDPTSPPRRTISLAWFPK